VSATATQATVKFDYTGDREAWSIGLVQSWLSEADSVALLDALGSL
jgi:hypothetical protein